MPKFLLSATDASGKRETQFVSANNSQEAYDQLQLQRYTDIVLHTEDVGATASASLEELYPRAKQQVSPADQLKMRGLSNFQHFLFLSKTLYSKSLWLVLCATALLVMSRGSESPRRLVILAAAFLFVPALIAVWATLFSPARKYNKLIEAYAWGRWEEVLARSAKLHGKVPEFELAARSASALAGLGKLDQARAEMSRFEQDPEVPGWMYWTHLSEVLETGQQYDEALECVARAYNEDPENPTLKLDYALALLRNERDPHLARQLIDEAKEQHLSDLLVMMLPYVEGLAALNNGKYAMAVERFESARSNVLPLVAAQPLIGLFLDTIQANLAIALAKSGQTKRAAEEAVAPRVRLKARNSSRLLKRLNEAVGPG